MTDTAPSRDVEDEGWRDMTDRELLSYAWTILSRATREMPHDTDLWAEVATAARHLDQRLRAQPVPDAAVGAETVTSTLENWDREAASSRRLAAEDAKLERPGNAALWTERADAIEAVLADIRDATSHPVREGEGLVPYADFLFWKLTAQRYEGRLRGIAADRTLTTLAQARASAKAVLDEEALAAPSRPPESET